MSGYCDDPLKALEQFIEKMKEPQPMKYRGPVYFLHHREWDKMKRGEPFYFEGILCKLGPGGHPEPV